MALYLFQAIVLILTYFHLAISHVMTMLPSLDDTFMYLEGLDKIEDFQTKKSFDVLKKEYPNKIFHAWTVVQMSASNELITELAYLECNRLGLGFDLAESKRSALEKRLTHPMALVYHPDLDSFTGNILTHVKKIKGSPEIQTLPLADTDLIGNPRHQYIVASEFIQIPRIVLEEYTKTGRLSINFKPQNADVLNYVLQNELAPEFKKIAKTNFEKIQVSMQFINGGYFDTNSPLLANSPLGVSQLEGQNTVLIHYMGTEESFIISEKIKKTPNVMKPAKKIARVCGAPCILI